MNIINLILLTLNNNVYILTIILIYVILSYIDNGNYNIDVHNQLSSQDLFINKVVVLWYNNNYFIIATTIIIYSFYIYFNNKNALFNNINNNTSKYILLFILLCSIHPMNYTLLIIEQENTFNSLLDHPIMYIHPPLIWASLILYKIHILYDKSYKYINITFLLLLFTLSIFLGGIWSNTIFGWGGFWIWDPIESISFLYWVLILYEAHSKKVNSIYIILIDLISFVLYKNSILSSLHIFNTDILLNNSFLLYILYMVLILVLYYIYNTQTPSLNNITLIFLTLPILISFLLLLFKNELYVSIPLNIISHAYIAVLLIYIIQYLSSIFSFSIKGILIYMCLLLYCSLFNSIFFILFILIYLFYTNKINISLALHVLIFFSIIYLLKNANMEHASTIIYNHFNNHLYDKNVINPLNVEQYYNYYSIMKSILLSNIKLGFEHLYYDSTYNYNQIFSYNSNMFNKLSIVINNIYIVALKQEYLNVILYKFYGLLELTILIIIIFCLIIKLNKKI